MLEPNENPLEAAKRELLEATGYKSTNWVNFGSYLVDPNSNVGKTHLFLALDARYTTPPDSDDLEDQELLFLSKSELEKTLDVGNFKVLTWTTVVALSLRYLANQKK
ncbi:MAG: NUDIX hydrolase [Anaerolineae bacterium]|jgi:ADP-ribose pyrophosphatase|nr:NUDIX hydrolase [Anaerolineae bacterium]MBT4308926.1 NUDIX hydrolase [Anaerolineae bacterium]MBT4456762.1 NUDIX hydrolase [Anaerolineae bacterium]MBT4842942.1 NUDIX hydrolase [Anaerolineae bacterium]MBT6061292.1 NUDIX hydrolase [Anaerolineae bacterium]